MKLSRLRTGEWLALLAGLVLFCDLFATWYGAVLDPRSRAGAEALGIDTTFTAWASFDVLDVWLAVTAALAVAAALSAAAFFSPRYPLRLAIATVLMSATGFLATLWRLADQPDDDALIDVRLGAWIGALAVLGCFAGAWRIIGDDRTDSPESLAQTEALMADTPVRPAPPAGGPETGSA